VFSLAELNGPEAAGHILHLVPTPWPLAAVGWNDRRSVTALFSSGRAAAEDLLGARARALPVGPSGCRLRSPAAVWSADDQELGELEVLRVSLWWFAALPTIRASVGVLVTCRSVT
jgi:hypothetical protein